MNAAAGELRRSGLRVRLSGQPFQILLVLLDHPGNVVTREQLREKIWTDQTFVDFEHGLNAAMNKLRRALGDSATKPKYIETLPGYGYRFIGDVELHRPIQTVSEGTPNLPPMSQSSHIQQPDPNIDAREVMTEPLANAPAIGKDLPRNSSIGGAWWAAAIIACVAVSFSVGWWVHRSRAALSTLHLVRLTTDPGLSGFPALSADGKLVAYSSDQDGKRDLYVKQVAGGPPIRLTTDGEGNTTPDFSPDGTKIVFRSERDGGGIYQIPAFGGEVRLVARDGMNPKVSPDGMQVAYWVGAPGIVLAVPGTGAAYVAPLAGGAPRRVGATFTDARMPIWSSDGKHLLMIGYTSEKSFSEASLDWWFVPIDGSSAIRTGAFEALAAARPQSPEGSWNIAAVGPQFPAPACWSATDSSVIFSMAIGGASNLWEIGVSPETGKVNGELRRVTEGAGNETYPSCPSGDTLTFAKVETQTDIWSLPEDLDRGRSGGALERITQTPAFRARSSISNDGRFVAFASDQGGVLNIWIRDLATGKESNVAGSSDRQGYPVLSGSGSLLAYSAYEGNNRVVYLSSPGRVPEKLCDACPFAMDWTRDEKTVLVLAGIPY